MKTKHICSVFRFGLFFLAFFLISQDLQAEPDCKITEQGDMVCGTSSEEPAKNSGSANSPTDSNKKGSDSLTSNGSPLLTDTDTPTPQSAQKQLEQLNAILKSLPTPVQNVLMKDVMDFFDQTSDPQKRQDLLKKLAALQRKIAELSTNRCGLSADAIKGDIQVYIHNAAATSVQYENIPALTLEQMDQYLIEMEKRICAKLKLESNASQTASETARPPYVATNPYIENYDPSGDGDVKNGASVPQGANPSSYAPGSTEAEMSNPNYELPKNIEGKGGQKIANCAKKMIGYSTRDVAATQGGRLGCILAVSRILNCAGYGVGTHLGNGLYDALKKDPCYKLVLTGHLPPDGAGLQPGDVLMTKRGSVAGHAGIYYGNGLIISNSSNSGTIRENFNTRTWRSVTNRNPNGSGVFRRVCE